MKDVNVIKIIKFGRKNYLCSESSGSYSYSESKAPFSDDNIQKLPYDAAIKTVFYLGLINPNVVIQVVSSDGKTKYSSKSFIIENKEEPRSGLGICSDEDDSWVHDPDMGSRG